MLKQDQRTIEAMKNLRLIAISQLNGEMDAIRAHAHWEQRLKEYSQEELSSALAFLFADIFTQVQNIRRLS